jgi:hypothetical protein
MDNTVGELKKAEDLWSEKLILLQQLSHRLLYQGYDDTYESVVCRTQHCLAEMQKVANDFPGREPWGKGYADACIGLRAVLSQLGESLKVMAKAKEASTIAASDASWKRVLESSRR